MVRAQLLGISVGPRLMSSDFGEQAAPVGFLCICFFGVDHVPIVCSSKSLPHVAHFVPHQAFFSFSSLVRHYISHGFLHELIHASKAFRCVRRGSRAANKSATKFSKLRQWHGPSRNVFSSWVQFRSKADLYAVTTAKFWLLKASLTDRQPTLSTAVAGASSSNDSTSAAIAAQNCSRSAELEGRYA